ncbi:MAG: DNA mismatch repair endonuclease MutL [Oscillospiraceae bacterium]|nr:DNA mismatch repair endonuclease MutL [Oscillospiraceae bacterium]
MGNIVLLDELTINKIAAGEVIERPASVVKELMENSIDAKATKITVEVKSGGISQIRIVDNGYGMKSNDLGMAFERHATSKIRHADDLEAVRSMGFRGEALASIAAIANVEMISKVEDEEIGNRIVVEAGNVLETGEAGSQTRNHDQYNKPIFQYTC